MLASLLLAILAGCAPLTYDAYMEEAVALRCGALGTPDEEECVERQSYLAAYVATAERGPCEGFDASEGRACLSGIEEQPVEDVEADIWPRPCFRVCDLSEYDGLGGYWQ